MEKDGSYREVVVLHPLDPFQNPTRVFWLIYQRKQITIMSRLFLSDVFILWRCL